MSLGNERSASDLQRSCRVEDYSADLASGQIKFRTAASGFGNVGGQITWGDALFLNVAGASSSTVTDILFTHHLDGIVTAGDFEFSDEFAPGGAGNSGVQSIDEFAPGGTGNSGVQSIIDAQPSAGKVSGPFQISTTVQNNGNEFNPAWVDPTSYARYGVPGGELNLWTG
ncbi:MAG: hypothetical protein ACREFQ_19160, partial [Stellaceae bacterium]